MHWQNSYVHNMKINTVIIYKLLKYILYIIILFTKVFVIPSSLFLWPRQPFQTAFQISRLLNFNFKSFIDLQIKYNHMREHGLGQRCGYVWICVHIEQPPTRHFMYKYKWFWKRFKINYKVAIGTFLTSGTIKASKGLWVCSVSH